MGTARKTQRQTYKVSRFMGDVAAAQKSPGRYLKRRARRTITRSIFRGLGL